MKNQLFNNHAQVPSIAVSMEEVAVIIFKYMHSEESLFPNICGLTLLLFFGRIPCSGWPEFSCSIIR